MRLQTAPTGPREHIELPIYFLKPHETAPTGDISLMVGTVSNSVDAVRLQTEPPGPGEHIELPNYFLKPHETAPTGVIA